jgi:hypothetical protein
LGCGGKERKIMSTAQENEIQELLLDGTLLPDEAWDIVVRESQWAGNIRYERSSGMYLGCTEGSGKREASWVKVPIAAAKQFLEGYGLFDGDVEEEVQRLKKKGDTAAARQLRAGNQGQGSVEDALKRIRGKFVVDRSGPRAGFPGGRLIRENGEVFLVTTGPALIEPEKGEFPTIAAMLSGLFGPDQPYFLAWMRDGVLSLRSGDSGLTGKLLVLAGPRDCGKSFLQKYLLTPLLGGRATDPFMSLSGSTTFNTLCEYEHWAMSDKGDSDIRTYATKIKEMVANEDVTDHPKNKDLRSVAAFRRISLSCNDEEKYLNVLPDIDDVWWTNSWS